MGRIERTFRTIGLRHKGVAVLISALLCTSFLYGWTAYRALGSVSQEIAERNRASAEFVAERFDRLLSRALDKLQATAALPGLAHVVEQMKGEGGATLPAGQTLHYLFMDSAMMTGGVILVDREGVVLWTEPHDLMTLGTSVAGIPAVQDVLRRARDSIGRATPLPGHTAELVAGVPLRDMSGNLAGGLFGFVDLLNPLSGLAIEPTALGRTAAVELVAGDDVITLADALGAERVGTWRRTEPSPAFAFAGRAEIRRVSAGERGPRLAAYAPLRAARWGILLSLDEAELLAPARSLQVTAILVGCASALLLALLSIPILNRLVWPVEQIAAAARALARGEFSHPLPARAHGELGDLTGAFGRMRHDIQDLVSRLRDSEARYRRSIDHAADPIVSLDPTTGVVLDANERALELTGIGPSGVGKVTFRELHPVEDHGKLEAHLGETLSGAACVEVETKAVGRDGQLVPVAIRSTLIQTGRERFVQQIWRDLSERKLLERRMVQTEKMSSLGVVAAGIAHEVRNPLQAVLSNVQEVQAELFGSPQASLRTASEPDLGLVREALKDAVDAARQIATIVADIHRFAHPGTERLGPGDVREVLDQAIRLATSALKRRATVMRDYEDVPELMLDGGRLTQVFLNLLVNAGHAVENVDRPGEIRVRTSSAGGRVRCEIEDNGCGIPEDMLAKVFDPFVTTKEPGKGTGLGLALALRIVHEHGGTIDVTSEVGKGTKFVLAFPIPREGEEGEEPSSVKAA